MKFTLSVAALALAASQVMAVIPIPIDKCTKTVIVQPTDIGCDDFAAKNGCTFADLLAWNQKLRQDCLNLDVGHPLCVSITVGAGNSTTTVDPIVSPVTTTTDGTPAAATSSGSTPAPSHPGASPVGTSGPAATASAHDNAGAGTKASIAAAVAGILISVAYML